MTRRHFRRTRHIAAAGGVVGVTLAMLVTLAGSVAAAPTQPRAAAPPCDRGTTVQTNKGAVCGTTTDGVTTYVGVPYAAPPVGDLRWKSPQPHNSWPGVLHATQPPQRCPSPGFPPGSPPAPNTSEDCLYLKIMKPADAEAGDNLPVMYEIHGGGFLGDSHTNKGGHLVREGNVVYVFVNYRIGILGFLAHQALGPHSGDYGLQDQQAGLQWVQDNIAGFGGNPHNVTIFGESAGGASVCNQVASPTAKGLFQKAISVSGFYNYQKNIVWSKADCKSTYVTEAQAQRVGAQFAQKVGCGDADDVAACLRQIPADDLVKAGGQYLQPNAGGTIQPIINGTTVTMSPAKAFATGNVNDVKLILDVGRDEFNGGIYQNTPGLHIVVATNPQQYRTLTNEEFGRLAPIVRLLYPLRHNSSPFIAYRTVMADSASVCPMLNAADELSAHIPVYVDIDNYADSTRARSNEHSIGALHSLTNHLVHDAISQDPNEAALQNQLIAEWTHFAHTGTPNATNTPYWALYGKSGSALKAATAKASHLHRAGAAASGVRAMAKFASNHNMVMSLRPAGASGLTPVNTIRWQHRCAFWDLVTQY